MVLRCILVNFEKKNKNTNFQWQVGNLSALWSRFIFWLKQRYGTANKCHHSGPSWAGTETLFSWEISANNGGHRYNIGTDIEVFEALIKRINVNIEIFCSILCLWHVFSLFPSFRVYIHWRNFEKGQKYKASEKRRTVQNQVVDEIFKPIFFVCTKNKHSVLIIHRTD